MKRDEAQSIFTKIIKGDIPCHKVYEDSLTYTFMDIHPIQPGHVLVVSKKQIDHIWDLPEQDYTAIMTTAKLVAKRLHAVLNPKRVGMKIIGVDVPHAHLHVFPFNTIEEYRTIPDMNAEPDHAALAEMAKKLAF